LFCQTVPVAAASETWITDKVTSVGSEHDYIAAEVHVARAPHGNVLISWTTVPQYDIDWRGHCVEFDLHGNRLRKVIEFSRSMGVPFRGNLWFDISPDSSRVAYSWHNQDFDDTVYYQQSCWFVALDYETGMPLCSHTRMDSADTYAFAVTASQQKTAWLSDTVAVVYWRENSSGNEPPHIRRYFQQVAANGELLGHRLDLYTSVPYICDESDTCQGVSEQVRIDLLKGGNLLAAYDAAGYVGLPIENTYSVARLLNQNLELLPGVDILMCDSFPCPVFTGYWGVSQLVDVDAWPAGGFAAAANIGYDVDITNLVGARAFDSLYHASSPVVGVSDHSPRHYFIYPRVVCGPGDEYAVVWTDLGENDGHGRDIWAQRFTRSGNALGVNHRLNGILGLAGSNAGHHEAAFVDGHLVVAHQGLGQPTGVTGDNYAMYPLYLQVIPWGKIGYYSPGDVDQSGTRTSADVVAIVNYVFKSGPGPKPQCVAGDTTGDCVVTSADIIYLVNYVFKTGPAPLNNCEPVVPWVPAP
jgi:hypothetical protein